MQACIIVPCFNEEKRISSDSFIKFSNDNDHISFIFVNDGSTDNTNEVLTHITTESPKNSFIKLSHNQGKAAAVRAGMLLAHQKGFTHIGYLDADLTIPLETAKGLIRSLDEKKVDFVFASRTKRFKRQKGQSLFRQTIGHSFSLLSRTILQMPIKDTQCGAKFFRSTNVPVLFEAPFMSKWIFDVEIFFRFKEHHHGNVKTNFFEYPLDYWEDNHDSKVKFMDYVKVPYTLMSIFIYYRT
ncbi:MAG: glycosyltransferase [Rhizobacter sp.]|nr:glycosyltransferase [Bacteriovorax sp.]